LQCDRATSQRRGRWGGLQCFSDLILFYFISKKHCNPPAPTKEPSCTTAPPWRRGDCNATEPPANIGGGRDSNFFEKKKHNFYFFSKKHCNPPTPTEEPLCTMAPPWGQGDCSAIEPPANQGCHNGSPTVKITVRTSADVVRTSARIRIYPADGFLSSADEVKTASARA
jgi:hypothetical protein